MQDATWGCNNPSEGVLPSSERSKWRRLELHQWGQAYETRLNTDSPRSVCHIVAEPKNFVNQNFFWILDLLGGDHDLPLYYHQVVGDGFEPPT